MTRAFSTEASQQELFEGIGRPAVEWLLDGFGAVILAFGQSGTGKSYTLFQQHEGEEGLLFRALTMLFQRIFVSSDYSYFTLGISCWDIHKNDVIDLLQDDADKVYVCVERKQFFLPFSLLAINPFFFFLSCSMTSFGSPCRPRTTTEIL
jgi:hypothetical protein